jgi:cytochrome b subunit of formate dehydrogenase
MSEVELENSGYIEEKYLRMTLNERIQHFCLLSSFITLVITGFALKFPESLWVTAIFKVLGENAFELRSIIHRIAAVLMVSVSIYHLFYIILSKRGKQLVIDLWFKKTDLTDLFNAFKYYTGRSKTRPWFGRFSYIEKAEYWAVVWGTIVMGGTGCVLWFENTFMPVISNSGMDIATAIHFYEAILASLAIFVWHFYFVIYNPDVYPMNKAWFKGYLTREEMELEHPLELEKLEAELKLELSNEVDDKPIMGKIEINEVVGGNINKIVDVPQDHLPDIKALDRIEKDIKDEHEKVINLEVET